MPEIDFYKTLGVSRNASAEEIRKAYKKLARKYHPDVRPGDKDAADQFKKVQQAYSILGDAEKRVQYDRYGHAFNGGRSGGPYRTAWASGPDGTHAVDLSDLFNHIFRRRISRRSRRAAAGSSKGLSGPAARDIRRRELLRPCGRASSAAPRKARTSNLRCDRSLSGRRRGGQPRPADSPRRPDRTDQRQDSAPACEDGERDSPGRPGAARTSAAARRATCC